MQLLLWQSAPDPAIGTGFDDVTTASHHFSPEMSVQALANRQLLLRAMEDAGFGRCLYRVSMLLATQGIR